MKYINRLKFLISVLAAAALIITVGCSEQANGDAPQANNATAKTEQPASSLPPNEQKTDSQNAAFAGVTVYFPDSNGEKLIAAKRQINPNRSDKYLAAVQALIDGPSSDKEGVYIMPKGTRVLSVTVNNGSATVDFSKEFKSNFSGGSTGEIMLIGSVVNTLTEFDDIKSVCFTIEGRAFDSLAGHLDLSTPQTRMKNLL